MKTEAAILVEQKNDLVIDEVELPRLDYGQVLVEVKLTRICGSQIGEIDGVKGPDKWLPHLLGHEAGGDVVEVGPKVTMVQPGDRVVLHWRPGEGIEAAQPKYQWNGRVVNAGHITTFSRYAIISENRMTRVAGDVCYETCALLADTLTTGFGVVNNDARVKIGESVVIIGCGGIGLGVVLGAKIAGAHPVVAVDLFDHKLDKAREYGATHTVRASRENVDASVRDIVGEAGCDVAIDGTGNPEVVEKAFKMTSSTGRCILFGVMPHWKQMPLNTLPLHFGKVLTGSEGGGSSPAVDIPRYLRMKDDGVFDPSGFISHRGGLDEINELIGKMRSGDVIHAVIQF